MENSVDKLPESNTKPFKIIIPVIPSKDNLSTIKSYKIKLARDKAIEKGGRAVDEIVSIMEGATDPKVRLEAAKIILQTIFPKQLEFLTSDPFEGWTVEQMTLFSEKKKTLEQINQEVENARNRSN